MKDSAEDTQDDVTECEYSRPSVNEHGEYYCVRDDEAHLKMCPDYCAGPNEEPADCPVHSGNPHAPYPTVATYSDPPIETVLRSDARSTNIHVYQRERMFAAAAEIERLRAENATMKAQLDWLEENG